jgi:hypothetical protein
VTGSVFDRIPKSALFGIFFVRKLAGAQFDSYYRTIDVLSPFLCSNELTETVLGFYLNHVPEQIDDHSELVLRISYFVSESCVSKALSTFVELFSRKQLSVPKQCTPRPILLAARYGGSMYEEPFRNFLNLQNRIGLELMRADLLHARCLFATYRWQVKKDPSSIEKHLEPTFEKWSSAYRSLSRTERTQFLTDLQARPDTTNYDWAHMMINLVLGGDCRLQDLDQIAAAVGRGPSISEINRLIETLEFQIPLDWKPD